jgi:flagellar hook-associated protein 3 FlgL
MAISGISSSVSPLIQSATDIRNQLDDLQRQLGSGLKAATYSGLGSQSGITVGLNAQLSALSSFDESMTSIGGTITLQQTVLQQIATIADTVHTSTAQPKFAIDNTGQTEAQITAVSQLDQMLSLLNTQGGNGYLFSGSGLNQPSVDTAGHILNGNGGAAGLKQVIDERLQADQGADGLGRLVIPAVAGSTVAINEDVAGSPFGLKLAGINTTSSTAIVSGPPASPGAISVNLGATNPNDGDTFTFTFTLPDKTTQTLQLQASNSPTAGTNQFAIGATPAATAANLQAALTAGVSQIVSTSVVSASAMAASNNFFDDPPLRVNGTLTSNAQSNYTADESGAGNLVINDGNGHTATVTFATTDNTLAKKIIAINTALAAAGSTVSATQDANGNLELVNASGMQVNVTGSTGTVAADLGFGAGNNTSGSAWAATALVSGTPANTVFWYTGDNSSASARASATARIDKATTVSYGTQANEDGIRLLVQNVATLAATKYTSTDPSAANNYADLNQRINSQLGVPVGRQNITDIEASLANVQTTIASTQRQHQQTTDVLTNMLQSIVGVDQNQVGVQILALQTSLSASLSATARLSQISLLNYL